MKLKSVLVVDPADNIRSVLIRLLKDMGFHQIFQASNGDIALTLMHEHQIDMIISEWELANVSGRELLLSVRTEQATSHIPFIICSSSIDHATVKDALTCGVSQFIAKPFSYKVLKQKIALSLNKPLNNLFFKSDKNSSTPVDKQVDVGQSKTIKTSIKPKPFASKQKNFSVLIVDDEINNIEIATKGINSICHQSKPELILLDIMMPEMDGYQVFAK